MDFEQQLKQLFFADDITRVRKQLKDNIVLFEDTSYTKDFMLNLLEFIKKEYGYIQMKQVINSDNFITIATEIYKGLTKYFNEKRFEINFILIYIIEVINSFKEANNDLYQAELTFCWEIISPVFTPNSTAETLFQNIDERIIKFNKSELLFVYTLRQMPLNDIQEFLKYHQKNSKIDYEYFLKYILLEYEPLLLEKTRNIVNVYLESLIDRTVEPIIEPIIEGMMNKKFAEFKFPELNPISDQLLDVNQTAKFLNLAKPTIYSLTSQNKIPFRKRGKKLYFKASELSAWLEAGKRKSNSELDAEAESYIIQKGSL